MFSIDLLRDAVVLGVLLGCFYAAVSVGLSISFGLLDVPQVAHPAFLVLASYGVFLLNDSYDIDPLLAGLIITPLFFVLGFVAYRLYYEMFEKRGSDAGVRGIAFGCRHCWSKGQVKIQFFPNASGRRCQLSSQLYSSSEMLDGFSVC